MEVCGNSPPNVAWGVATADSSPAASRSPPYASFRTAVPYRLCARPCATSNFFRRAEGFVGAAISCLPSVLTAGGVSGSILRSPGSGDQSLEAPIDNAAWSTQNDGLGSPGGP